MRPRRGRDRRGRVRRARHGHRTAPGGPRRLRRARAGGLRRRNLARQHLPGRRVRRALAPLRLRRAPEPRRGRARMRAATRSGRTSSASSTRRSSAIGCGCARRCDGPTGMPPTGCGASAPAPPAPRLPPTAPTTTSSSPTRSCSPAGGSPSPRFPGIAGLETFPGPLFHSARWDHSADLAGARVGDRRHGGERDSARARTRADGGTRHPVPAHAGVDRAARRRRVLRRRPRPVRGDAAGARARCAPTCTPRARRASRRGPATADAAAEAEAVALAHLERAGRRPGAARRAHAGLRVRLQARAAVGRLLPGRGVGRRDARAAAPSPPSRARRSSPRTAPVTRSTRSCSRPASPRPVSPTPSSSRARAA